MGTPRGIGNEYVEEQRRAEFKEQVFLILDTIHGSSYKQIEASSER